MTNLLDQQGDVVLYQTNDDGEINITTGLVEMNGGLETSAYLSLFGGNEDDDGSQDTTRQWWGNLDENEESKKFRSKTQNLLRSIPAISSNLRRIEDAALKDLNWFITEGVATSIEVAVTIPSVNRVSITINIDQTTLKFIENWRAQ